MPLVHDSQFLIHKRFIKAFEEMQPEHNWVLDISKPEEEILSGMKQKGRYNIKIAEKNGMKRNKNKPITIRKSNHGGP